MKAGGYRVRRWHCKASAFPAPFGDYVFAPTRAAARAEFIARHHVEPFSVLPA